MISEFNQVENKLVGSRFLQEGNMLIGEQGGNMGNNGMKLLKVLLGVMLLGFLTSCGSGSSNNDQGTSFSATGWREIDENGALGSDVSALIAPINSASNFGGRTLFVAMSLQSFLTLAIH